MRDFRELNEQVNEVKRMFGLGESFFEMKDIENACRTFIELVQQYPDYGIYIERKPRHGPRNICRGQRA
jgi:hypothetical protein